MLALERLRYRGGKMRAMKAGAPARAAPIAHVPEWSTVMRKVFCSGQAQSWVRRIFAALKSAVS